jgi:hypothetical protein
MSCRSSYSIRHASQATATVIKLLHLSKAMAHHDKGWVGWTFGTRCAYHSLCKPAGIGILIRQVLALPAG